MMICGDQIRLTADERNQLAGLTGTDPSYIKTAKELGDFVRTHAARQDCRGPGACLAKRFLMSFDPTGLQS